jgi:hypothetical protein
MARFVQRLLWKAASAMMEMGGNSPKSWVWAYRRRLRGEPIFGM